MVKSGPFGRIRSTERNNSQAHILKTKFELDRKANRSNFYKSIISKQGLGLQALDGNLSDSPVKPRWNKSIVSKVDMKRKLFQVGNHLSNYSVSLPNHNDFLNE